jgi:hypothetical protein
LADAPPGSLQGLYLVVPDIEDCRKELTGRGVTVSEIRHKKTDGGWRGGFLPGPDPDRRDYASFADFRDPDATGCCKNATTSQPEAGAAGGSR